jgi:hypothetical protein
MKTIFAILLFATTAVLFGCDSSPATDPNSAYRDWSLHLKEQMTEDEVQRVIGVAPSKVELRTCGQNLGKPWQCKAWVYGSNFTIRFQKAPDDLWRVNSWHVS